MNTDVTLVAALVAGVFSISSPCVLPLLPIYLAHITGVSIGEPERARQSAVLRNAVAYVLGFSLVFIVLGAAWGAVGQLAGSVNFISENRDWLVRIGGIALIVLGLHQTGIIRIPFLYRDAHLRLDGANPGTVGSSFIIGVGFGAGWTPCMGPILGAILTMAASQADTGRAMLLLTLYSIGLAVPFLAAALVIGQLPAILRRINRHLALVTTISGAIMIGVGVVMILGLYEQLFIEITRNVPWQPYEPTI